MLPFVTMSGQGVQNFFSEKNQFDSLYVMLIFLGCKIHSDVAFPPTFYSRHNDKKG